MEFIRRISNTMNRQRGRGYEKSSGHISVAGSLKKEIRDHAVAEVGVFHVPEDGEVSRQDHL